MRYRIFRNNLLSQLYFVCNNRIFLENSNKSLLLTSQQQKMMAYSEECRTGEFEASLCGCCSDCESCCYAYCCYNAAKATAWAEVRGESTRCCHCWNYGLFIKANIRHIRGMEESLCCDCCAYMCCPCCALSQDLREIKAIKAETKRSGGAYGQSPKVVNSIITNQNSDNQSRPMKPYGNSPPYTVPRGNEYMMQDTPIGQPLLYPTTHKYPDS
ncbi:hypothetical protein TRFO_16427 [Tritrichomonas foetus]|uniref:PLAC8 family protein n=1 Tax=Tritrichomonas foetus TaxID=1144522 RepID=A0A1J4KQ72_9EUKA|nr:hypothetical protein TRFO_16427 [Tritrichomonas foetus]|eukprot:OHT13439.1 hypothetical protein TRFO_16427 [Tritrichomonas foetus]